jgi:hypothetical protein
MTLNSYERGNNGEMRQIARKVFPTGDAWSNGTEEPQPQSRYFELPRHRRTVLVGSLKTKRILHRVTWNGEKFVDEEK